MDGDMNAPALCAQYPQSATGILPPVRVKITLGTVVLAGVASTNYNAVQGKGGTPVTVK